MQKLSGIFLLTVLLSGAFSSSFAFAQAGPTAQDDSYSVDEDSLLTVNSLGVLLNDTNTDSDTFTAILQTDVGFGALTLNSDGSFSYQPNQNFDSTDSFTYVANNGSDNSNEATVTISITPVNDPPTAEDNIDSTQEDTAVTTAVIANDTDVDSDSLEISSFDITSANGGTISLDDNETPNDATDDKLTYTPLLDFVGSDTYSYTITDGTLEDDATVTITVNSVNDPPTAEDDLDETKQNVPILIDVLENDSDIEGDSLDILLQIDSATKGTAKIQDSKVLFTPDLDFVGDTTFSYMVSDGQNTSNSADVTVTVTPVEDPDDGTVLDRILNQIQSIFDKILNIEDEVTQLKEDNSALAMRITELEAVVKNGDGDDDQDNNNYNNEKVTVCHKNKKTISISENGLSGHLRHGDSVGECSDNGESSKKEIEKQIKELKKDKKNSDKDD